MKLIELLQTLDPEQPIKIGAKDGSSFFYIGTPKDMLATFDTSSTRYAEYDMVIYKSYERAIKRYEEQVSDSYNAAMKYAQEHGAELTSKGFKKALRTIFNSDTAKNILKMENKLAEAEAHQRQTKSMQDRDVVDSFNADKVVDEGTLAIIVEGFEYGRYWTKDEAPKGFGNTFKPSIKLNNKVDDEK